MGNRLARANSPIFLSEREHEGFRERDHRIRPLAPDRRERGVKLGGRLCLDRHQNKTNRLRRDMGVLPLGDLRLIAGIP